MMLMCFTLALTVGCQKEELKKAITTDSISSQNQEAITNDNEFKGPLNITLDGFAMVNVYEAHEFDQMKSDIADFILGEDAIPEEEVHDVYEVGRIQVRKIASPTSGLINAYAVTILDGTDVDIVVSPLACKAKSKKCCSKSCVAETIEEIYSADREVDVTYRKGVCRTITWTYQDC